MASCCASSPKQWRREITDEESGGCLSVSCQPAVPGAVEQSTIDLLCDQCAAGASLPSQNAPQGAGSGSGDPCQPSPDCASQATPTMASCCASSPKQWRMEITDEESGGCLS